MPESSDPPEEILPFEMEYIPENFKEKAERLLNEYPSSVSNGIEQLSEMVKDDETLEDVEFDSDFLLMFLRYAKHDVAEAFQRMKTAVELKRRRPQIFTNQRLENIVVCFTDNIVTFLPYRCRDGCAIIHINLDNWIPEKFPIEEVRRMTVILLMQSLRDPMTQLNGFKVIFNAQSNPLKHLRHCTWENLWLMYHGTQNCFPGRFQEYHLVNQSVTSRFCLTVLQPFFSEELKKKIIVHNSVENLLDFFPSSVLPKEYGGDLGSYDTTDWIRRAMHPEKLKTMVGKWRTF